jgi:hypothetical protein
MATTILAAGTSAACAEAEDGRTPTSVRLAIPTESLPGESLVAATPKTAAQLVALGYDVLVEAGAGAAATFSDEAYLAAGAKIVAADEVWSSDVVLKVNEPSAVEIGRLRPGATVVARMPLGDQPQLFAALNANRVTGLSLDAIPRISRAQSMDVLSTMSNIAGYRGVIEAAESYGGMFAGQVTAAGKTQPATVFVIGAGVAGLAAIGAAWAPMSGRSTSGRRLPNKSSRWARHSFRPAAGSRSVLRTATPRSSRRTRQRRPPGSTPKSPPEPTSWSPRRWCAGRRRSPSRPRWCET